MKWGKRGRPPLYTEKHERFVQAFRKIGNVYKAAEAAGFHKKSAQHLLTFEPVLKRLREIEAVVKEKTNYDAIAAMNEAKEAMEFAKKTDNANAYVRAVELRSKLNGLLIERHDVRSLGMFQIQIEGVAAPSGAAVEIEGVAPPNALPPAVVPQEVVLPTPADLTPVEENIFDEEEDIFS